MRRCVCDACAALVATGRAPARGADAARRSSLRDAEARALQNHPADPGRPVRARRPARRATREVRSAYFPTVFGSVTGVEAKDGSRIAAGGLNNPTILDRVRHRLLGVADA